MRVETLELQKSANGETIKFKRDDGFVDASVLEFLNEVYKEERLRVYFYGKLGLGKYFDGVGLAQGVNVN